MNVVDIIAEGLTKQYPDISFDEGRIIAFAYQIHGSKSKVMIGNPDTPPDGYFVSTVGIEFLGSSQAIKKCCNGLVAKGHLNEHPSCKKMMTISERMIPVCEIILSRLP